MLTRGQFVKLHIIRERRNARAGEYGSRVNITNVFISSGSFICRFVSLFVYLSHFLVRSFLMGEMVVPDKAIMHISRWLAPDTAINYAPLSIYKQTFCFTFSTTPSLIASKNYVPRISIIFFPFPPSRYSFQL